MKTHKVGIIMNGVTGRMGSNQHLMRSIVEIIRQGGVKVSPDEVIMPDPILVGSLSDPYNPASLERLSKLSGIEKYSTDVEGVLANPDFPVYFDSQSTTRRFEWVSKAIAANKHVYCEKPSALTKEEAYNL
ncbi:MAG: Gfo/Idh/MocA family oxidoreductase, partial [Candidatus Marinimicrobia bacterium]|nr:Gfo/Idh/MocA family oxidoreductase [Candidatus Neomarinimicrobiota bacterium]